MNRFLQKTVTPALPRVKCLLVDDLKENLLALSALLSSDEVEVLTAQSGSEALELLLIHDVALALLDVQMPEMDGFELAELMRGSERTRHVPLIFVTAGMRDQTRTFKGYENGAVDFLYKPIEAHILQSKAEVFFQLHRQKQQLAQQLQERTETLRLNEIFNAVLGHDLRNPLNAIVISAQLLQRRSDDAAIQEIATRLLASGKWMGRMIDDMLDVARARLGGGISLNPAPMELGAVVRQVVHEHRVARADFQIDVHEDGDLYGDWDADRLAQVTSNLIGNALHHGQPTAPIRVVLNGVAPDFVSLCVINAGSIAADILPHLFDPFRGRQTQTNRKGGLGLGLYIVQQIVRAHGGEVSVQALPDAQIQFEVRIPRRIA